MSYHKQDLYGDGIGYVVLLDTMGDEYTPAEDARTSTGKGRLGAEKDSKLQLHLLSAGHTSPFEGALAKFEVCVPIFVRAELDRHRTLKKSGEREGLDAEAVDYVPEESFRNWMARNEMSGRYIQMPPDYYHPPQVRQQAAANRQGTSDSPRVSEAIASEFVSRGQSLTRSARDLYDWAVSQGVEKGQARIYNTQNQYTKIRYTGSVKNWLDFLKLRLPVVVLWECRRVAECVESILHEVFPDPVRTWQHEIRDGIDLNREEVSALRKHFQLNRTVDDPALTGVFKKLGVEAVS